MTHLLATVVRNICAVALRACDRLDPQPPVEYRWPCHIHTPTGTNTGHVTVTYRETATP